MNNEETSGRPISKAAKPRQQLFSNTEVSRIRKRIQMLVDRMTIAESSLKSTRRDAKIDGANQIDRGLSLIEKWVEKLEQASKEPR